MITSAIINFIIDLFVAIFDFFVDLLPTTPFQFKTLDWGVFGEIIGLIFPVSSMATHFTLILVAIGLYYAVRWGLRLIKMTR